MKKPNLLILTVAVVALAFGCSKKPETLVTGDYDEKAMDAAIERARAEVDTFIKVVEAGEGQSLAVKAPIKDANGTEHFWLTGVTYADGTFSGKIGNEPGVVQNVKFGQSWEIKKSEISDWMYHKGDKIHGGYTIDPLLPTMPEAEAALMRQKLVREAGSPGGGGSDSRRH